VLFRKRRIVIINTIQLHIKQTYGITNEMAEVIVIGGFGSSPEQMNNIAHRIGEQLGRAALGINFRSAVRNIERTADLIHGRTVITHSGGAKPVVDSFEHYGAEPGRLIAVAPPVPEQIRKLLWRGAMIGRGIGETEQEQLEEKFTATEELVHHPIANFGRIYGLGHFAAIAEIARMRQGGIPATVGLMSHDGLFDMSTAPVEHSIARARQIGVNVVNIFGRHCRFSADPAGVMQEIGALNQVGYALPEAA